MSDDEQRDDEQRDDDRGADSESSEPLGPVTPDHDTALGDTPEAHDEINPRDLPPDHPGRREAERQSGGDRGTTQGGN